MKLLDLNPRLKERKTKTLTVKGWNPNDLFTGELFGDIFIEHFNCRCVPVKLPPKLTVVVDNTDESK